MKLPESGTIHSQPRLKDRGRFNRFRHQGFKHFLRSTPFLIVFVFLVVFMGHVASRNVQSFDSIWSVHTARSILLEGNTDLNEYTSQLEVEDYRDLLEIDGHFYTIFPVGPSIMAIPFVAASEVVFQFIVPSVPFLEEYIRGRSVDELGEFNSVTVHKAVEVISASFIVALTAVFILLMGLRLLESIPWALVLVFIFSFCSPAISTASRGLWPHGPSMLMLALSMYLLIKAEDKHSLAAYASLPLAFAYVIRPTNAVPIFLFTVYVFIKFRKTFLRYLLWSLPVVVPFVIFNMLVYGFPISPYYMPDRLNAHVNMAISLPGTLISPGRGLFLFSPVFLFSLLGIWMGVKKRKLFDVILVVTLFIHWIIISSFKQWWGGHAFGPRYFCDVLPLLVYFLVPAIQWMRQLAGKKKIVLFFLFGLLCVISFGINIYGANSWVPMEWNTDPTNIDFNQDRLWDWSDPQFLR